MSRIGEVPTDHVGRTDEPPEPVDVTLRWSDVGLFLASYVALVVFAGDVVLER
jgi:hypothetical protein